MKFTQQLYKHNLIRWARRQLFLTSRRKVWETQLYRRAKEANIPIFEASDVAKVEITRTPYPTMPGCRILPPKLDSSHPDWHEKPCLFYRDRNVLVEGLNQAKVLTNTVELENGLPSRITALYDDELVKKERETIHMALASAVVYDPMQEKLPRRKNLEKPMWVFPRDLGITERRKNYVLCRRFLHLCELLAGLQVSENRCKFEDAYFSVPLLRDEDVIQLQIRADLLLLANESIQPICSPERTTGTALPNLEPLKYTVSLDESNLYQLENIFPVGSNAKISRVHTAFIHYNEGEVKNLHGTPVTEDQIISRSLMKAFAIASAQARYLYGDNVETLPEPIVLQCIQTDAKDFHFSVFQLNTLAWPLSNSSVRNVFWSEPVTSIYEYGGYFEGKPTITSYNPEIFKMLYAFYLNR